MTEQHQEHTTDDLRQAPSRSWHLVRELWPIFATVAGVYTTTIIGAVQWGQRVEARLEAIERTQPDRLREKVLGLEQADREAAERIRQFWARDWPHLQSEISQSRDEVRALREEMLAELRAIRAQLRDGI